MKILVIRVGNIGDVLMATPLVRKLKEVFPGCSVDFLTSPQARPMVLHNPHIENLFVYHKLKGILGKIRRALLLRQMKKRAYDLCFILELHPQYKKFIDDVFGAKTQKIGFLNNGGEHLDQKKVFSYDIHVITNYFGLLKDFFKSEISQGDYQIDFFIPKQDEAIFKKERDAAGRYVVIHPGCTEYLPYRGWNPEKFSRIIGLLSASGYRVFLTGRKSDQDLVEKIIQGCADGQKKAITPFLEKDIYELGGLIKYSSGVLCSDTGILHIARAFHVPVVGLFGPSNPLHTGFIGQGSYRYIRNDFKCGPCNYYPDYRFEDKKYCLDGKVPACMRSIEIQQVEEALKEILNV